MGDFEITRADLEETAVAVGIVVAGLVIAWLLLRIVRPIVHVLTRATENDLDDAIAAEIRVPVAALIVVQAAYIALRSLSYLEGHTNTLERLWAASALFVLVVLAWRVVSAALVWYGDRTARMGGSQFGAKLLPIIRRVANITIILVGGVLVLDQLGIAVSPLLAGLGIGGLAVALAVQPILANIFAGSYVLSDGSITVGNFIEIEGGPTGWVEDIGWRATKLRTFDNNLIILPNSTLAAATVTNFDVIDPPVGVPVRCGIAYEEDLGRVEAIVMEELLRLREEVENVDKEYQPFILFESFGDSNVDFLMKVQAVNRRVRGSVAHEMIKRVHARFGAEGITINYPARRLFLEEDDTRGLERLVAHPASESNGAGS